MPSPTTGALNGSAALKLTVAILNPGLVYVAHNFTQPDLVE